MTTWHTILGRSAFEHFPCVPEGIDVGTYAISYFCSSDETPECKISELCPLRPIYEEYRALRAVAVAFFVRVDGSEPTPERVLKGLRGLRDKELEGAKGWDYYDGLVKAVEKLEALETE